MSAIPKMVALGSANKAPPAHVQALSQPLKAPQSGPKPDSLSPLQVLLALEGEAMGAEDRLALKHMAVNKPRALVKTGHIFFLTRTGKRFKIEAVSSQTSVEKNSPLIQWLTRQIQSAARVHKFSAPAAFAIDMKTAELTYPFSQALYVPFAPDPNIGGLLFTRTVPWADEADEITELQIPQRLAKIYGLQWTALGRKTRARWTPKKKTWVTGAALIACIALCIPVPVTTLAPAEIVAANPSMVTAPMNGVIKTLHVAPNSVVKAGTPLLTFEDTDYVNEMSVAAQDLSVSSARLRRASLSSFVDADAKREIAVTKADRDLAKARMDYAQDRLSKTVILAPADGLVIYSDPKDWTGRPVSTGETIMEIADPKRVILRLEAPIVDSAVLENGAKVRLFLNADPIKGYEAHLTRASYYAQPQAGGQLAYEAFADLHVTPELARIGARGVAKIYGQKAPLGYWLARRPLSAARQFLGL